MTRLVEQFEKAAARRASGVGASVLVIKTTITKTTAC